MTELVEMYRRNAERCLQLGQDSKELEAKRALLVMANAWLMLAAQRQKNIETASPSEPPSPVNEPPPPLDDPPKPPPNSEPPKPPPINDPPTKESPPLRFNSGNPDDLMRC
jgi:hypothetical protein